MKKYIIVVIAVVVVLAVGGLIYWYSDSGMPSQAPAAAPSASSGNQPASSSSAMTTSTPAAQQVSGAGANQGDTSGSAPVSAAPKPQSFAVNGNDLTADLKTITVPKGTPVTITFGADAQGTYHGGLDFRSSVVSTGPITPGSTKTVTFTATNSFSFTPYWPSTNIAKPYTINIVVES